MAYVFKGSAGRGALCSDCIEPLVGLTLKFYSVGPNRNATVQAVANAKDTFMQGGRGGNKAAAEKKSLLLAETVIDERGNFSVEFPETDKHSKAGPSKSISIAARCRISSLDRNPRRHCSSRSRRVQPMWRKLEKDFIAAWEYTVPYRYWCSIRGKFGAWTICGHVRHCATGAPIGGVTRARLRCRLAAGRRSGP